MATPIFGHAHFLYLKINTFDFLNGRLEGCTDTSFVQKVSTTKGGPSDPTPRKPNPKWQFHGRIEGLGFLGFFTKNAQKGLLCRPLPYEEINHWKVKVNLF